MKLLTSKLKREKMSSNIMTNIMSMEKKVLALFLILALIPEMKKILF